MTGALYASGFVAAFNASRNFSSRATMSAPRGAHLRPEVRTDEDLSVVGEVSGQVEVGVLHLRRQRQALRLRSGDQTRQRSLAERAEALVAGLPVHVVGRQRAGGGHIPGIRVVRRLTGYT